MITHHKLNVELSKKVCKDVYPLIQPKRCYNNIFDVVSHNNIMFSFNKWKVAYGYINVLEDTPFMTRHCFIINEKGEAIDPTLAVLDSFNENMDYNHTSFVTYELTDYLISIDDNEYNPDLIRLLRKKENETIVKWALENEIILIGS